MKTYMENISKRTWKQKRKIVLVEAMGGECVCCGYKVLIKNLALHHLDPTHKEHGFGNRDPSSWSKVIKEARKCVLVCNNCHSEIHAGITTIPENAPRFNEDYTVCKRTKVTTNKRNSKNKLHLELPRYCKQCQNILKSKREQSTYCSRECLYKSRMKNKTSTRKTLKNEISKFKVPSVSIRNKHYV